MAKNGTLKISSAAAALNQMELSGSVEETKSTSPLGELMSVSHDQLVLGEKELVKDDNSRVDGEPAAISAAKQAAKQIVGGQKKDAAPDAKVAVGLE